MRLLGQKPLCLQEQVAILTLEQSGMLSTNQVQSPKTAVSKQNYTMSLVLVTQPPLIPSTL